MSGVTLPHKLFTVVPLLLTTEDSVVVASPRELQLAVHCKSFRNYFFCKV